MSFGSYFKDLRKSKKITQKQVAVVIGKTTMLVSGVETGKNNPFSNSDLEKIAELMNLSKAEEKLLFRNAARSRGRLPVHLYNYVINSEDAYELLEYLADSNLGNEDIKKIKKYAEDMKSV